MPGTLVFPLDSRRTGRQILSRVESLPPHPKGCPLVCLVETPGGGRGGGQQEQQSPHHCLGGAFLRERRSDSGDSDRPHLSSQHSSACQPHSLHPSSFWGNWEEHLCLVGQHSASWKPLQSLPCLCEGGALSTTQVGAPLSPCRFWELGGQRESWSQSWLLSHLPAPAPLGRCPPEEGRAQPMVCVLHCKLT